jgi:insertion element IS1 protein InsB
MICINCQSNKVCKNGHRRGKQNYLCRGCGKQFVEFYSPKGYPDSIKEQCLTMYVNGQGFRAIERITGVNHNTVINWVKQVGFSLPDAPDYEEIPEVAQLDELQTFVAQKKNKVWLWTAVNQRVPGILAFVLGDRSAETFKHLWKIVRGWECFFYVTDGYCVYDKFINDCDRIISKTYMTRVEGENTRLRHYLARLHRRTLCYSKSEEMLQLSIRLLLYYLKYGSVPMVA